MENQVNIAAHRLAIFYADEIDIPARYKSKSDKQKKFNLDSSIEIRFRENVEHWKRLIDTMLSKIDRSLAWRFINSSPILDNISKSVAYHHDFIEFINYLVLRRDIDNCDSEELGRLVMLSGTFQKELEKMINSKQ